MRLAFLVVVCVLVGAHYFAYRWLRNRIPIERVRSRWLILLAFAPLLLQALAWILARAFGSEWLGGLRGIVVLAEIAVLASLLPLALITAALSVVFGRRLGSPVRPAPLPHKVDEPNVQGSPGFRLSRRDALELGAGGALFAGASGTLVWGALRGRLEVEWVTVEVRVADWPRALEGYTIAQISDLHVGPFMSEARLTEVIERIGLSHPDLIVATGDLLDHDPAFAPALSRALARAKARDGISVILGNHDYYAGASRVTGELGRASVSCLVNQARIIRPNDGGGFVLAGLDDMWARNLGGVGPDLDRALRAVVEPRPIIALAHQPIAIDLLRDRVDVQLSGHTHGGQINPGFVPARWIMRHVAGLYKEGRTALYVNRGLGTAGPPSRVLAPPEITRIVLVGA